MFTFVVVPQAMMGHRQHEPVLRFRSFEPLPVLFDFCETINGSLELSCAVLRESQTMQPRSIAFSIGFLCHRRACPFDQAIWVDCVKWCCRHRTCHLETGRGVVWFTRSRDKLVAELLKALLLLSSTSK